MRERARSSEDKAQRSIDLLRAAENLAIELGGVRFVTVAAVTERSGLHRTGVRRYFASKEELLLELAERGWEQWRDEVRKHLDNRTGLSPQHIGTVLADSISSLPVFCDLLAHVPMSLEGDVDIERAREFKTNTFSTYDDLVAHLVHGSDFSVEAAENLVAATISLAAGLWQTSNPTPTLATLYEQVPRWGHVALDFTPRLTLLVQATAVGLAKLVK